MIPKVVAVRVDAPVYREGWRDRRMGKCPCGQVLQFARDEHDVTCPKCKQTVAPPVPELRKGIRP